MRQGWKTCKFADVFDLQMGKTPSRDNPTYWGDDNMWVSIADMNEQKYMSATKEGITDVAVQESGIKPIPKGTVIMSFKLSIGKVSIATSKLYTNEAIMGFIEKEEGTLVPEYLYYYLKGYKWEGANKAAMGMTLNKKTIAENTISYPPIAEQEKIVAELDCLSGIIEKKKQQLKELDNLAQSIFYEMFGDPVENDKGWDIVTLDDVFEIGSSKRVFESQWTDSGVPFYRAREIVKLSKGENIDSPIFISEELYHEYSRKYGVPAEGDMMVTAVGTLGVCYLVKNTDRFYFKDGNTLWFKSRGLCETRFIKDEFATDFIVNQIKGNANAAVVGTYTITNAKKTRVILPPLSLQQEYVRKIQHIDKQKELLAQSIKETETLFNSRMDYYFN